MSPLGSIPPCVWVGIPNPARIDLCERTQKDEGTVITAEKVPLSKDDALDMGDPLLRLRYLQQPHGCGSMIGPSIYPSDLDNIFSSSDVLLGHKHGAVFIDLEPFEFFLLDI
jgi:hypothetical protein